jgi:hypothetical protein
MRSSTQVLIPLLSLLLAPASALHSAPHAPCLRLRAEDLADASACGISSFIAENLRALPDNLSHEDIDSAYRSSGCSESEAAIERLTAIERCSVNGDLRRRAASDAIAPLTMALPNDAHELLRRQTDTAATPAVTQTSKLQCSTTRTESTTLCSLMLTGAAAGETTCKPTIALYAKCADGLICSPDGESCMVAKTTLDTGGIIVTIGFSAALTLAIALLTFMCCRERAMHKRLAAKAEAAELAKEAAAASKKSRADAQPLMAGSPGGPRAQSPASPGGYGADGGSNPFNDGNRL